MERLVTMFAKLTRIPSDKPELFDTFAEALTLDNTGPRAMSNLLKSLATSHGRHTNCRFRKEIDRHPTADATP
jgi:hypothetical protein